MIAPPATRSRWGYSLNVKALPQRAGVYVAYLAGELVYVGMTLNLRARFRGGHRVRYSPNGLVTTPWGTSRNFYVKYCLSQKVGDEVTLEARLIRRLRPAHNSRGVR